MVNLHSSEQASVAAVVDTMLDVVVIFALGVEVVVSQGTDFFVILLSALQ